MSFEFTPPDYSFSADYSLGSGTIAPELPNWDIASPTVPTYGGQDNPTPVATGNFFSDTLKTVQATADTFLGFATKIYSIDNQISTQKYNQTLQKAQMDLQKASLGADIDVKKATTAAQRDVALAQAAIATANAQAQVRSSQGASIVSMPGAIPWTLIGVVAIGGIYFLTKGGK